MNRLTTKLAVAALLVGGLMGGNSLVAQGITTGSISGTLVDSTGSLIPNATVTAKNPATGLTVTHKAAANGGFDFSALPTGTYSVTVSAQGFGEKSVANIPVHVGRSDIGKVVLSVGSQSVEVEVSDATPLLETSQAQMSQTFSLQQVSDLPTNGGFDQLALLSPGVVQTHDGGFSNNNGAEFSSNGQRGRSNNFEIDGQSNNDNSVAGPQIFFGNQDALDSIQVITNSFSAQYGHNMGSVVNYLTRQGTNGFHGAIYEFYEGSWLESFSQGGKSPYYVFNNCAPGVVVGTDGCVAPNLTRYVENKFGGALAGPILKDKLFFSVGVNFDRYHQGPGVSTSGTAIVPTQAGLNALAAAFPGNAGVNALQQYSPYANKVGNPTGVGPVTDIPVTYSGTTVSVPFQAVQRGVPLTNNDEEILARLDYQLSPKDRLFVRYFYQDSPYVNANGISSTTALGRWYDEPSTAHSIGADWTHTFNSHWVDQLRYSFQQTSVKFEGGAFPNCKANNPQSCPAVLSISGTINNEYTYGGYGTSSTSLPQGRVVKVTQIQDNATYTKGRHSITFGGEFDYQNSPNFFLPYYQGAATFSSYSNLLAQSSTGVSLASGNPLIHFTEPDAAAYFQDDWKILPNLTLNLGVRWEYFGAAANLLHDETATRESNPATAFWLSTAAASNRIFPQIQQRYRQFQPRLGFAYQPDILDHRMVIRGGYSMNYDPEFYNIFLNSASAAPVALLKTGLACSGTCLNGGLSGTGFRGQNLPTLVGVGPQDPGAFTQTTLTPNFQNPYAETWNLGVEYSPTSKMVFDIHYVGNHAVKLFQSLNANPSLTDAAAAFPSQIPPSQFCSTTGADGIGRLDCSRGLVRLRSNGAASNYNSVQIEMTSKNWHGLSSTLAYTYSHTFDNASEVFSSVGGGGTNAFAQNPLDPNRGEYAHSGIDVPNVVSASFVYELPFYQKQEGLLGRVLGGYQLNGIYTYDSGNTVTPFNYTYDYVYGATGQVQGFNVGQFCDSKFNYGVGGGLSSCRPYLSNPKANIQNVGIMDTDGQYYELQSYLNYGPVNVGGTAVPQPASAFHYLYNNETTAIAHGGPFTGTIGRNTLRATSWNNLNASIFKNVRLKDQYTLQLSISGQNVLNRQYIGTLDPELDDPTFQDRNANSGSSRTFRVGARLKF